MSTTIMSVPPLTRLRATATAQRMALGGWEPDEIREYLARRGQRVSVAEVQAWTRRGRMPADVMLALRVEDGLSYAAIAKVADRIFGESLSEGQVRERLYRRGVPKDPTRVRGAANFTRRAAA